MQFVHLSYLEQLSALLEDNSKSQAARLGHIAKQIREKHVVHVQGSDTPKLRRCRACQGPITCEDVSTKRPNKIVVSCSLCGHSRRYDSARPDRSGASAQVRRPA